MTDCIEWTGYLTKDGYGETRLNGVKFRVHRLEWIKQRGPIPEGLVVRHKCDNPKCYNIEHLELGTTQDNTRDRVLRNRSARGVRNGNSKLTPDVVLAIRASSKTHKLIAEEFCVSKSVVTQIRARKTWRHI